MYRPSGLPPEQVGGRRDLQFLEAAVEERGQYRGRGEAGGKDAQVHKARRRDVGEWLREPGCGDVRQGVVLVEHEVQEQMRQDRVARAAKDRDGVVCDRTGAV